jgi:rubrerythrin
MGDAARIDRSIGTVEALLAVAEALEREAARRYRGMATRMARQGNSAIAAVFETLAALEERHVERVADRARSLLGRPPELLRVGWDLPPTYDEDEAHGAELSAYHALAFAVRNEERAFAYYTYVAAEANNPDVRALAEELARDELDHASILRHRRRRAFHADRPLGFEVPAGVDALRKMARRWDSEAATAHAALADQLATIGETEDAAIFRRLAENEEKAAAGAMGAEVPRLRSAADGLRLLEEGFDRFALIAEQSHDERVIAEAQRLAGEMVGRLALAAGARSNTLIGAPAG